jgi:hypothetical protein
MNNLTPSICYLCGRSIQPEDKSDDHVVPHQFIKRSQPKAKGFDYGRMLPTHKTCNNHFGSEDAKAEVICQKAIEMLRVLHDQKCVSIIPNPYNPNIPIQAFNPECLNNFTQPELNFFGLTDTRNMSIEELQSVHFLDDKKEFNVYNRAKNIALTVLAKSAAAILVRCYHVSANSKWQILAVPHFVGDADIAELTELDKTKPFEVGVQAWVMQYPNGDWFVMYKVHGFVVEFHFTFSVNSETFHDSKAISPNRKQHGFKADTLMDLIGYDWCGNVY